MTSNVAATAGSFFDVTFTVSFSEAPFTRAPSIVTVIVSFPFAGTFSR